MDDNKDLNVVEILKDVSFPKPTTPELVKPDFKGWIKLVINWSFWTPVIFIALTLLEQTLHEFGLKLYTDENYKLISVFILSFSNSLHRFLYMWKNGETIS